MFAKAVGGVVVGLFVLSSHAAEPGRTFVPQSPADARAGPPISEGVLVGDTFYLAGQIGIDPATNQVATNVDTEARLVMGAVRDTLARGGLEVEDLVSVVVYCTDLSLYDKFNAVYRTYFHGQYPARAFVGVSKVVRGAHFEVAGIAVKPSPRTKP